MKSGQIRIGIGGWTFEPWRGVFYPKGSRAFERAGLCERAADLDRGQRHVLSLADAGDVPQVGERGAEGLRVLAQGSALRTNRRVLAEAGEFHQALSGFRRDRARRASRPPALAVRAVQKIRSGRLRQIPRSAAGKIRRPYRCATSSRCGIRASWCRSSSRCCGSSRWRRSTPTTPPIRTSPTSPPISSMRGCSGARTRSRPPIRRKQLDRMGGPPADLGGGQGAEGPRPRRWQAQDKSRAARRVRLRDPRGQDPRARRGDGADREAEGVARGQAKGKTTRRRRRRRRKQPSSSPSATN